jgi:hypothetical protein
MQLSIEAGEAFLCQLPWRPMSTSSHVFYQLGRLVNPGSACVFVLNGRLDAARLRLAAAQLAHKHPLLRSLVHRRRGKIGWVLLPTPAADDVIVQWHRLPVLPLPQLLEQVVGCAWREERPLDRCAPFALNVFETPTQTVLQIITSHIAEDAHASYQISEDLAQLYGTPIAPETPPTTVHPPQPDMDALLREALGVRPADTLRAWCLAARDMTQRDAVLPLRASADGRARGFAKEDITAELADALRAAAKLRGVSFHALLLLALCCVIDAGRRQNRPRHIRLLDMFSLRGFAGAQAASLYENLVVPYSMRIECGDDRCMLSQIQRQIHAMKAGAIRIEWRRYALGSRILSWFRHPALVRTLVRSMTQATVLVTNPGRIPFALPHFGELEVCDFFTHAQLFPPGAVMCQFSGFREGLRVLFLFDTAAFCAAGADFDTDFRQPFLRELQRLAGGNATASIA